MENVVSIEARVRQEPWVGSLAADHVWMAEQVAMYESHPMPVIFWDTRQSVITANACARSQFGERASGSGVSALDVFFVPDNKADLARSWSEALRLKSAVCVGSAGVFNDHQNEAVMTSIPLLRDGSLGAVITIIDSCNIRSVSHDDRPDQVYKTVLNNIPVGVFWKNRQSIFLGCNGAMARCSGLERPEQIIGKSDFQMPWARFAERYRADDAEVIASGRPKIGFEQPFIGADGKEIVVMSSKVPLRDERGMVTGVVGIFRDISEQKLIESTLERMAYYDGLSGLANRALFYETLNRAAGKADRSKQKLVLIYFDIDRFKSINDEFGHQVGDQVIAMFGKRLSQGIRRSDLLARLGGDEFALILEDVSDMNQVKTVAQKILDVIAPAFDTGWVSLNIRTSIGIATYKKGTSTDALIHAADQAMYQAKARGGSQFYICDK